METGRLIQIHDDGLDLLAAHHRTDTTARSQPRRAAIGIAKGNPGQQPLIFADWATDRQGYLLAIVGVERFGNRIIAAAQVRGRIVKGNRPIFVEVDHHPIVGGIVQGKAGDVELA